MKIVFDVDDTLWALNSKVCSLCNIDENKVTDFNIDNVCDISDEDKDKMVLYWGDSSVFNDISWYNGVSRINDLVEMGHDVSIHSNCMSIDVRDSKYRQIKDILNIDDSKIKLSVVGMEDAFDKKIGSDVSVFVDDSPYHVSKSKARINLMIKCPWNQSDSGLEMVRDCNVKFFDDLNSLIDYIYEYVKED